MDRKAQDDEVSRKMFEIEKLKREVERPLCPGERYAFKEGQSMTLRALDKPESWWKAKAEKEMAEDPYGMKGLIDLGWFGTLEPDIRPDVFWLCNECRRKIHDSILMRGRHPFRDEGITGCSHCGSIDLAPGCDTSGCHEEAVGVFPTPDGFKSLCHAHAKGLK